MYNLLKRVEISMIVTSKDSVNPFVNVGTFSKIRKLSVRQKIQKHVSMLTVIPIIFILLVNFVGIRFDNVFSILVSCMLMVILMWEIYHFARANVLQTEYKYFYSRGVLIVSFVVWLLIQTGFAISATIFRKVTVDDGWFVIDGVYPLVSTPIGIFVWIVYGVICSSLFGKTLFNLSRSSYDDIPEEQFCDKFMDSKAIHEIGDTRERNKFYGYYISFFILSVMGSIILRWTDSNDNVYFKWFNLIFIGGALISGAIFAV